LYNKTRITKLDAFYWTASNLAAQSCGLLTVLQTKEQFALNVRN